MLFLVIYNLRILLRIFLFGFNILFAYFAINILIHHYEKFFYTFNVFFVML